MARYATIKIDTEDLAALRKALAEPEPDLAAIMAAATPLAEAHEVEVTMFHSSWGAHYTAKTDKPVRLFRPWRNPANEIVIPVSLSWLKTLTITEVRGTPDEAARFAVLLREAIDSAPIQNPELP